MKFGASITMLKKEAETIRSYISNNAKDRSSIEERLTSVVKLDERYQRELNQYMEAITILEQGEDVGQG